MYPSTLAPAFPAGGNRPKPIRVQRSTLNRSIRGKSGPSNRYKPELCLCRPRDLPGGLGNCLRPSRPSIGRK